MATKKKPKRKPKADPTLTQAQNAATVQFNPEQSTLFQMLADAKTQRRQSQLSSAGAASSLQRTIGEAGPKIQAGYDQAIAQIPQATQAAQALSPAPQSSAGSALLAAIGQDVGTASRRAISDKVTTTADLEQQKVQAKAGGLSASRAADTQYASDTQKIFDRLVNVEKEKGAFTEKTYQDLLAQADKLGLDKATLQETIRGNKATEKYQQGQLKNSADANDIARQKARDDAAAKKRDKAGVSPTDIKAAHHELNTVTSYFRSQFAAWNKNVDKDGKPAGSEGAGPRVGIPPKGGSPSAHVIDQVAGTKGVDREIVQAGYEYALHNKLRPSTRQTLQHTHHIGGLPKA